MSRKFDHLVLAVENLERASQFYEAIGFTLTPQAQHPFGTGNRLAQMQGCFLEILGVTKPENVSEAKPGAFSFGAYNRDFLKSRQGMSMMVLQSDDAKADRDDFRSAGLQTYEMFDFSREARQPDGSVETVGFTLAFASVPELPEAVAFTCQQWRPDLFWKPEYQDHPNTANSISEVFMVADDAEPAERFLKGLDVDADDARVSVMTPSGFAERFPGAHAKSGWLESGPVALTPLEAGQAPFGLFAGFKIKVADLEAVRSCLRENRVDHESKTDSLWITPRLAYGCVVEFAEENK
jgi:catechol 2,3-dioxygenase-like lactoylglutathione lyase family enzyme